MEPSVDCSRAGYHVKKHIVIHYLPIRLLLGQARCRHALDARADIERVVRPQRVCERSSSEPVRCQQSLAVRCIANDAREVSSKPLEQSVAITLGRSQE